MVRGALIVAASLTASDALAATYHCVARVRLDHDGAVLADWRGDGGTHGRVSFSFDTATGDYVQRTDGSAAAITGAGKLRIVRGKGAGWGTVLAMAEHGSLVVKLDDSAHGVNYVRLDGDGLAEIGTCENIK